MYDNVKNVTITYHIKKKRFLPCMGFLRRYPSLCFSYIYVTDVECAIVYFPALL
jgi:hypothetical protein